MAEGQPFIFEQVGGAYPNIYDEKRNNQELGGGTTIYRVTDMIPGGGIQIDAASTNVNPVVQFIDTIRKMLPWYMWVLIGFAIMYFKRK